MPRTERVRIWLDSRYPEIVRQSLELLQRSFPHNRAGSHLEDYGSTTVVWLYCSHLTCLFPQHGPGKKHERPIVLEPWQERIVEMEPWAFLRACIRSDGCIFINPTGQYRYLSYEFANSSCDIRTLFTNTLDLVGVRYYVHEDRVPIAAVPASNSWPQTSESSVERR